jgi:hypothetical protein
MRKLALYCTIRGVAHVLGAASNLAKDETVKGVVNLHFAGLWFKLAGKLGEKAAA